MIEKKPETDLFYVNPATGVVTLKKLWPGGDKIDYAVSNNFYISCLCIFIFLLG